MLRWQSGWGTAPRFGSGLSVAPGTGGETRMVAAAAQEAATGTKEAKNAGDDASSMSLVASLRFLAIALKFAGSVIGVTSLVFFFRRIQWRQVRAIRASWMEPKHLRSHLRLAIGDFEGGQTRASWLVQLESWMKTKRAGVGAEGAETAGAGDSKQDMDPDDPLYADSNAGGDTPVSMESDWRNLHMRRAREKGLLVSILSQEPSGPVVLTGASGSGKSALIREVLSNRPWTMYMNLHQDPVGGSDFLTRFVRASGYYNPPIELVALGILRQQITEADAEKALHFTTIVLQQLREQRQAAGGRTDGPNGVPFPVLCLDQMHEIPGVSPGEGSSEDAKMKATAFSKFMDWCVYVTDAKLAHVVFVTRPGLLTQMDKHLSLRFRREQVYMALMSEGMSRAYFRFQVNAELERVGLATLSESTIARVVDTLGGNLKDTEAFLSAILRGKPWKSVLRSMVRESTFSLEMEMDDLLREAAKLNTPDAYRRVQRFWNLLKYMARSPKLYIPRRELISAVFLEASHEIEDYVASGILAHTDVAQHYFQNAMLQEEQDAIEIEREVEREVLDPEYASSVDNALEEALRAEDAQAQQRLYALQGGLDEHWVMPASPRLKVAMRRLTTDPRLKQVERQLIKKIKTLTAQDRMTELRDTRRAIAAELDALASAMHADLDGPTIDATSRTYARVLAELDSVITEFEKVKEESRPTKWRL